MSILRYVIAHSLECSLAYEPMLLPDEIGRGRRSYRGARSQRVERPRHPATESKRASARLTAILRRARRRG